MVEIYVPANLLDCHKEQISYHGGDPNVRFLQYRCDPVPVWAQDVRSEGFYSDLICRLNEGKIMTFEQWWAQKWMPTYAYSNVSLEEIEAARSAAEAAWSAGYDLCHFDVRAEAL